MVYIAAYLFNSCERNEFDVYGKVTLRILCNNVFYYTVMCVAA